MTTKQEHDDVLLKMIIADLGSIAPVSPKEEKRLITVMVEGQLAAKCLIQASNLSPKICEQLIEKERAGSAARRRLIETNGRLVISIAKKYTRPGLSLTDLCQEGMLGLIRAIDGFDRKKGERLSTYASYWIKQKISEAVRKESHEQQALSLEEPLYDDSTTLTDILEDESGRSLEEMTDFTLLKHEIDYVLASLTDKERCVLQLRYGLRGEPPLTLRNVANRLGRSIEHIRQIESEAMTKLRQSVLMSRLVSFIN